MITVEREQWSRKWRHLLEKPIIGPQDIASAVALIGEITHDDESAHSHEDELHQHLIEMIAAGKVENVPMSCAEALKTKDLNFSRWCA